MSALKIYDCHLEEMREATQVDVDSMQKAIMGMVKLRAIVGRVSMLRPINDAKIWRAIDDIEKILDRLDVAISTGDSRKALAGFSFGGMNG